MSAPSLIKRHLSHGRFVAAANVAKSLLASDAAGEAASLLLEVRQEQGWFADAILLARERFNIALPATRSNCIAALRLHVSLIFSGARPDPSLRSMRAIASTARSLCDQWLGGLAAEMIAINLRYTAATGDKGQDDDAIALMRAAVRLYSEAGDARAALLASLRLAAAAPGENAADSALLWSRLKAESNESVLHPLLLAMRLQRISSAPAAASEEELGQFIAACDAAGAPVFRGRALWQKALAAFERGAWDAPSIAGAREVFRAEEAFLDLAGMCNEVANRTFAMGRFAAACNAAEEARDVSKAMPFPHGEGSARIALASALVYLGKPAEAAAEFERVATLPERFKQNEYLSLLPHVGLLIQLQQPELAETQARLYVRELQRGGPSVALSLALDYLANANIALRRWPEVFTSLEQGAAVDEKLGDLVAAIGKRTEIAYWRFTQPWLAKQPIPADIAADCEQVFQEAEAKLSVMASNKAELQLLTVMQKRGTLLMALRKAGEAIAVFRTVAEKGALLGSRVHELNAHVQLGLLLHHQGRNGDEAAARAAQHELDRALAMHRETGAAGAIANVAYLAGANERVLAHLSLGRPDEEEARAHFERSANLLYESEDCLSSLLLTYSEPGVEASELARIALHGNWKKVYDIAVELFLDDLGDAASALEWSERWKARALSVTLGAQALSPPAGVPSEWIEKEQAALAAMSRAKEYGSLAEARRSLEREWNRLGTLPQANEYLALRRGTAIAFDELVALLGAEAAPDLKTSRR